VFRRRQFLTGRQADHQTGRDDLDWYRPDGNAMNGEDRGESYARAVTMALSGATGDDAHSADSFLVMLNG
jgi:pullulanase/glycogen debranching enzyme